MEQPVALCHNKSISKSVIGTRKVIWLVPNLLATGEFVTRLICSHDEIEALPAHRQNSWCTLKQKNKIGKDLNKYIYYIYIFNFYVANFFRILNFK